MLSIPRKLAPVPAFVRAYAGKYPRPRPGTSERPPLKHRDPLLNAPDATVTRLEDENLLFVHRNPPSLAAPESTIEAPTSPLLQQKPPTTSAGAALPPLLKAKKPVELKTLSEEDIAKMRELRSSDPEKYSANTLAKMFGCTRLFVTQNARLRTSQRKQLIRKRDEEHSAARTKWNERHQLVKAMEKKRREFW